MANNDPSGTSREIATTNNTLNAFVGGKQRSWMTNPGAPISTSSVETMSRKRSAAGRQLESAIASIHQNHPITPISPRPRNAPLTTQNSTNNSNGSGGGEGVHVLPSPAPSEGRPSPAAPSVTAIESMNLAEDSQQHPTFLSQAATASVQENEDRSTMDNNRGMEFTSRRHQPQGAIAPISSHFTIDSDRTVVDEGSSKRRKIQSNTGVAIAIQTSSHPMPLTPVTSPGLTNRPDQYQDARNGSSAAYAPPIPAPASDPTRISNPSPISVLPPISGTVVNTQIQHPQVSTQKATSQHNQAHIQTIPQPNSSVPAPMHLQTQTNVQHRQQLPPRAHPQSANFSSASHRRSSVQYPNSQTANRPTPLNGPPTPLYKPYQPQQGQQPRTGPTIGEYLNKVGGNQALLPAERVRIEWLLHALSGSDWGFLTLHQLYCLSETAKGFLEGSNLLPPDALPGFFFLGQLLSENRDVNPHFLEFFSRFPDFIQALIGQPWYQTVVRDLLPFLRQGLQVFTDISNRCLQRRTSPTAEELVIHPFTCSVVLQRLVWRRIRVALDRGVETSSGAELEKQFIAQQFEVLKSRGLIPPPKTAQDHQWWLALQQQTLANQQATQNKFPGLNQPLQPGYISPGSQLSPTFQQFPQFQQVRAGSRLPAPPITQDGLQQQSNQNTNIGNSFVTLQPGLQAGQLIPQHQANQDQVVVAPASQSPTLVQSPLASTVQTPRLPGNFCQTSVDRSPNAVFSTPAGLIGTRAVASPGTTPHSMIPSTSRRPSLVSRGNSLEHYISVVGFAAQCTLPDDFPCATREFTISQEMTNRLSLWEPNPAMPGRSKRSVQDRSLIYRLRCIQAVKGKGDIIQESNWVLKETTWPPHLFIQLNNQPIMLRRKHIYYADLYVDITNQVRAGSNTLKIAMLPDKVNAVPKDSFLLRVEILEARSYSALVNHVIPKQLIDKATAKAAIIDRLKPSKDEDVVVVKLNELTLSIVCPFTMALIKTPVRGKLCRHIECFDLDNYLISRPQKKRGEPPNADSWKCPHCNGDARPTELVVDGFVMDVVAQVKGMQDVGDFKEVVVKPDGSWEQKKEEVSKGKGSEREKSVGEEVRKVIEVITIDDD